MTPANRILGIIAMIAAPFMSLQVLNGQAANMANTSLGGVFDVIYMTGWMASIAGLLRLKATGTKRAGVAILYTQLLLLCVANVWNVWVIIDPANTSSLFFALDLFWPLSNVCMLVTGIVIAVTGVVKGWQRYVPLLVGLWLPVAIGTSLLLGRENAAAYYPGCIYSTLAWALLGWVIYTSDTPREQHVQVAL